jgi:hypothetical protein
VAAVRERIAIYSSEPRRWWHALSKNNIAVVERLYGLDFVLAAEEAGFL